MVETAEILSRIDSMDPAAAGADRAEIARIAAAAKSAAERLAAAFGDGALEGVAARASATSSADLSRQIDATSAALDMAQGWLSGAGTTLGSTVAFRPRIAAVAALGEPGSAAVEAARTALAGQLTGVYNAPMARSASDVSAASISAGAGSATQSTGGAGLSNDGVGTDLRGAPDVVQSDGPADVAPATAPLAQTPDRGGRPEVETPSSGPQSGAPQSGASPSGAPPSTGAPSGSPPTSPGSDPRSGGPAATAPVGVPLAAAPVPGVARPAVSTPRFTGSGLMAGRPPGPAAAGTGSGSAGSSSGASSTGTTSAPGSTSANSSTAARSAQVPYGAGPTARRTEDDRVHRPADYLRSTTEGMLVLGPQPVVGPAVIGQTVVAPEDAGAGAELDRDSPGTDDDQELDLTL